VAVATGVEFAGLLALLTAAVVDGDGVETVLRMVDTAEAEPVERREVPVAIDTTEAPELEALVEDADEPEEVVAALSFEVVEAEVEDGRAVLEVGTTADVTD